MKPNVQISFAAKPELRDALERVATAEDRTLSSLIRRALKEFLSAPARLDDQGRDRR